MANHTKYGIYNIHGCKYKFKFTVKVLYNLYMHKTMEVGRYKYHASGICDVNCMCMAATTLQEFQCKELIMLRTYNSLFRGYGSCEEFRQWDQNALMRWMSWAVRLKTTAYSVHLASACNVLIMGNIIVTLQCYSIRYGCEGRKYEAASCVSLVQSSKNEDCLQLWCQP